MADSSAKRLLKKKRQSRAQKYLNYAESNSQYLEELLTRHSPDNKTEILDKIYLFLANAKAGAPTLLDLPPK